MAWLESTTSSGIRVDPTITAVLLPRITLIGAGSGGGTPQRVLEFMQDELSRIDFDGDVRIVCYRKR
jgi:hypothetical protein